MILDKLSSIGSDTRLAYPHISEGVFGKAFDFLQKNDLENIELGQHDISGDQVFAIVQDYITKDQSESKFEAHKKYIDIQYIISGKETIYWRHLSTLKDGDGYSDKDDAETWGASGGVPIEVEEAYFVILYPHDAHMPCCHWGNPKAVKKVVIKIAC